MQLDANGWSLVFTVGGWLVSSGATYGIMRGKQTETDRRLDSKKERLTNLEKKLDDSVVALNKRVEETMTKFVTLAHFESVVRPLQEDVRSIQSDIKEVLKILTNK